MFKKKMKSVLSLLLSICLCGSLLTGCGDNSDTENAPSGTVSDSNSENGTDSDSNDKDTSEDGGFTNVPTIAPTRSFSEFVNSLYAEIVTSDTITLHYSVVHPENYGITPKEVTFGSYDSAQREQDIKDMQNYLSELKSYDYNSLSYEEQLIYDGLRFSITHSLTLAEYAYYEEPLGPLNGIQSELPILLAEYHLYSKSDVETYLKLLTCLPAYFESLAAYEREKSAAGLFMQDSVADAIIEQCENFIKDPENNLLLDCFETNLANVEGLTTDEITLYTEQNREAVLNDVIPAYQQLIQAITDLKGTGKYEGGLANLPEGAAYFEKYAQGITGSSKTMEEMEKCFTSALKSAMVGMSALMFSNPKLMDEYNNIKYPTTDPIEGLEYLKKAIQTDFPALTSVDYSVKYVHPSLQEFLSPAFYLLPPIDDSNSNNIYINNNKDYNPDSFFTTLAHEGYPGHLYQNIYFLSTDPNPIRQLLRTTGYTEGWGTYAEIYGYSLGIDDENLSDLSRMNLVSILCLYGLSEIGIHYRGWSYEETVKFWGDYGIPESSVKDIYQALISDPGTYLPYVLGYLEFLGLREEAMKTLGDKFNILSFHTFLLDTGALPFDDIRRHMEAWMEKQ